MIKRENSISAMRLQGIDLNSRWETILEKITQDLSFVPDLETLEKSEWWKTGKIGAVQIKGKSRIKGKSQKVLLKIQGTKPTTSEVKMISSFMEQNESTIIRTPQIYGHLPWNEKDNFEAILFEFVESDIILSDFPPTNKQLNEFFEVYSEYRKKCRKKPWLEKPSSYDYSGKVKKWMNAVSHQSKNDKYKSRNDYDLAEKAISILEKNISPKILDFEHGHLAACDIQKNFSGEYVLFSNLFWGWRPPFYDAVFEYHWSMLGMQKVENLTTDILEKTRDRWFDKVYSLPEIRSNSKNTKYLELSLLERAVPALIIDRYLIDLSDPSSEIIIEGARKELKRLIDNFS